MLRGREVRVLRFCCGEDFLEGRMERCFFERDGLDVGRGLLTIDELLEPGLERLGSPGQDVAALRVQ